MKPVNEECVAQLEKILTSKAFHGSESLRAFLKYIVEASIQDHDSRLKEYTLGVEVFARKAGYDPQNDSIVRVQAGRLRSKLLKYYSIEGKEDKVLIDLPKGHYNPVFSYAQTSPATEVPSLTGGSEISDSKPPIAASANVAGTSESLPAEKRRLMLPVVLSGLLVAVGALALKYETEASRLRETNKVKLQASADVEELAPLWSEFFNSSEPILIAYSNTRFQGRAETGMKLLKPLDSPRPLSETSASPDRPRSEGDAIITDHYTGVGEVMGVYSLGSLFSKADHAFKVKRSLLLNWDDLKTENIVILGSPAENLLLRQLPRNQDFVFRVLKAGGQEQRFGIENLKRGDGEQAIYTSKEEGSTTSDVSEDYSVVSLLKGFDANHRLMILAGITTFGTQAAAEYVTNHQSVKELMGHIGNSLPVNCQILLRVKINGGVPVQTDYVTHHILN
jgi:hypothetical protein